MSSPDLISPTQFAATGAVTATLRLEGAVTLVITVILYRAIGGSWSLFAALFLLPDLSMVGYLANPRLGARLYNLGHTTLGPAILAMLGWSLDRPGVYAPALIWVAHIGFDRLLGYGLKYPGGFTQTHLSWRRTDVRIGADAIGPTQPGAL